MEIERKLFKLFCEIGINLILKLYRIVKENKVIGFFYLWITMGKF